MSIPSPAIPSDVFQVFTLPFIQGDPVKCLYDPYSVVLTESMAKKFFGKTDVVGETLEGENQSYKVTGVISDLPKNTHLIDLTGDDGPSGFRDWRTN